MHLGEAEMHVLNGPIFGLHLRIFLGVMAVDLSVWVYYCIK
jgi:hypothetical protein